MQVSTGTCTFVVPYKVERVLICNISLENMMIRTVRTAYSTPIEYRATVRVIGTRVLADGRLKVSRTYKPTAGFGT